MEGATFFLVEMDIYSGYRLDFPAHNVSAKTATCGLTECLIHGHGTPHTLLLIKELTSQQVK